MNYKSQLRAWAVDMVSKLARESDIKIASVEDVKAMADTLVEYAYIPSEDRDDHMKIFFDMLRNAPPGEANIEAMIGTLEHIQNDRYAQRIDVMENKELRIAQ